MKKLVFLTLFVASSLLAVADVRLPAVIGHHMVLQQNADVSLWGWCEPGETITIRSSWDTMTYTTKGTPAATWNVTVKTPHSGGPYKLLIKGNNTIELEDVLLGEVWLCSGQSNMEMSMGWGLPYEKEAAEATNNQIRFFHVPRTSALHPQDDVKARWVVCRPEELKTFSAVAYFFGKEVNEKLQVPVGLINASWGGTPAEVWAPEAVVNQNASLAEAAGKLPPSEGWPVQPGATYNAMIYPLHKFAIAGCLWYQGESNTGTWSTYQLLLTSTIAAWREGWKKDFPFYLVQIAPFAGYGAFPSSALLREQQTKVATYPNTGMVVIHDLVDNINDIHPKRKKEVGQRLAAYALTHTYGVKGLVAGYPQFQSLRVERDKIRLHFSNAEAGLIAKGKTLTDFKIAGSDKVFFPANATLQGHDVIVWSEAVKKPVAVRYGFTNAAMPNLFSREGLPVGVFRTDNWEITGPFSKK